MLALSPDLNNLSLLSVSLSERHPASSHRGSIPPTPGETLLSLLISRLAAVAAPVFLIFARLSLCQILRLDRDVST